MKRALQEKCGIVGIFTGKTSRCLPAAITAAGGVQHRGQQGAGIALLTEKGIIKTHKAKGLLREIFTHKVVRKFNVPCRWAMVHLRYGTFGSYLKENLQPCIVNHKKLGQLSLIHNGEFTAVKVMLAKTQKTFAPGTSDTYIFTSLLCETKGQSWEDKVLNVLKETSGAYSLIIGTPQALYAARDRFGIRPLVLGKLRNNFIVASETHALDKVGAKLLREVGRGEVIRINKNGIRTIRKANGESHFCDFEWAYFNRPDSLLPTHEPDMDSQNPNEWLSVTGFREQCGHTIALESPVTNPTFAVGIPDSGIAVAMGYANALKFPYRQVIIRDHFDVNGVQRLFMRDDQLAKIRRKVLGKLTLIPDKRIWKGAVVVIGDDSIVRGNVSREITKAVFGMGAREVHWIVGFPPVMHPCHLGVSMRSRQELIAPSYDGDPQKIAKAIGATSVRYITPAGFIASRRKKMITPKDQREIFLVNGGCGGCLTGIYPVDREGREFGAKSVVIPSEVEESSSNRDLPPQRDPA